MKLGVSILADTSLQILHRVITLDELEFDVKILYLDGIEKHFDRLPLVLLQHLSNNRIGGYHRWLMLLCDLQHYHHAPRCVVPRSPDRRLVLLSDFVAMRPVSEAKGEFIWRTVLHLQSGIHSWTWINVRVSFGSRGALSQCFPHRSAVYSSCSYAHDLSRSAEARWW